MSNKVAPFLVLRISRVLTDGMSTVEDVGDGCSLVGIKELIRSSGEGRRRYLHSAIRTASKRPVTSAQKCAASR